MKLAERLREIVKTPATLPPALSDGQRVDGHLEQVLGGTWHESAGSRCFVVERSFEPGAVCGRVRIGDAARAVADGVLKAPILAGAAAPPPFLFFDLETTGLNGGAGTYVFLVGCGSFHGDAFVTRQYLLATYRDEPPMLHLVAGDLARAGALVSFNGRSFDAPVLETRYLFHRLDCGVRAMPHLDVLHPARRFWGGPRGDRTNGAETCSLATLEQQVLGARRTGDVPGFEIPARYFQFVRSADARPLAAVLEHNRLDLLALAVLCAELLQLVTEGPGGASTAQEALALGRLYLRAGLEQEARDAFERALVLAGTRGRAAALRLESLHALAVSDRRARRYPDAAARWRELLATPGCPDPLAREAAEALAIYHEHRVRDLIIARSFALRTLESASLARTERARHRLARIDRKLAACHSAPLFPAEPVHTKGGPTGPPFT